MEELDAAISNIRHRPDFVAVLGHGIIGPAQRLRNQTNAYLISDPATDIAHLSKSGRHTLLRLYIRILDECNTVTLPPLDLKHYLEMPRLIGKYRVQRAEFVRTTGAPLREDLRVETLTVLAVEDILSRSAPVTRRQNYLNWVGAVPSGPAEMLKLDEIIYEYNPRNLPAIDTSRFSFVDGVLQPYDGDAFMPIQIEIDGAIYSVDFGSLPAGSFELTPDLTADELFAL